MPGNVVRAASIVSALRHKHCIMRKEQRRKEDIYVKFNSYELIPHDENKKPVHFITLRRIILPAVLLYGQD